MTEKEEQSELDANGCLRLAGAVIRHCLNKTTNKVELRRRLEFAESSKLLSIFCSVAKIDYNKLKYKIIRFNNKMYEGSNNNIGWSTSSPTTPKI